HQTERVSRAVFHTGRPILSPMTKIAFVRRGFNPILRDGCQDNLHGAERTGHHTGFTADTFLLIDLYTVVDVAYCPVRTASGTGGIFAVAAGHRAALM